MKILSFFLFVILTSCVSQSPDGTTTKMDEEMAKLVIKAILVTPIDAAK